ncbi:MAG: Bug family tripartite tricarboxylate transporter substrate binding protein [Xanthobacteraceae bacterium]
MARLISRILAALCIAALLVLAAEASAETWPARPVRLIVPTGPGHAVDIMARMLTSAVGQSLGQPVYVENMPGASGFLGAQTTARAEPDGYTFLLAPASLLSSNMYLFKSLPYDPTKDFAAVAMVCDRGPMVVTVNPDLPIKTVPELIAYGQSNPGKLSYAVDATSGFGVAAGRLLNKRGQIGMVEVPYRSSPQMAQDTMAGTTQLMVGSVPPVAGAVKSGKLRWIAISSDRRFPGLEELPTIAETLPGFRIDGWFVVVAPAGTPASISQRFNRDIDAAFKSTEIRQRALALGLGVSDAGSPESTAVFIRSEQERWRSLVQELGMDAQ